MHSFTLLGLIPLAIVALLDMQNILSWSGRRVIPLAQKGCLDYTILIPLYGHPRYFEKTSREALAPYKDYVVVICDVGTEAMQNGANEIEAEGWRVFRCWMDKPTAPMLMKACLDADVVKTRYVARLDADTVVPEGFDRAIEAVKQDGADLVSVKCHVLNPQSFCEKMQAQEYEMAMLSRHYRPWLTSGACYIAKTQALKEILKRHTLWFLAEDSETGRVAFQLKMRIRHVDFTVYTAAPPTWKGLLKQRANVWWAGNFRQIWVNFDHNIFYKPVWTLYYAALVWIGLTWKWESLLMVFESWPRAAIFLGLLFASYTVLTFVSNWQVRGRYMLLVPYYSLLQSMLMPPVGFISWLRYAISRKRLGRFCFSHRRYAVTPQWS